MQGLGEDIYDKKEIAGQKDGLKADENSDLKLGENKPKLEGKSTSSEPITLSAIGQKRTVGQNKNK